MLSRRIAATLLAPAALVLAASMMLSQGAGAHGTERCPAGGIKLPDGTYEYCAKDEIATSVCIKAGNKVYTFTADDDKCYSIKGIGTECVTVGGGGTGRDCKSISGVTVYVTKK